MYIYTHTHIHTYIHTHTLRGVPLFLRVFAESPCSQRVRMVVRSISAERHERAPRPFGVRCITHSSQCEQYKHGEEDFGRTHFSREFFICWCCCCCCCYEDVALRPDCPASPHGQIDLVASFGSDAKNRSWAALGPGLSTYYVLNVLRTGSSCRILQKEPESAQVVWRVCRESEDQKGSEGRG